MNNNLAGWQRVFAFILGLIVLAAAAVDTCSRVSQVIVGLLLMGVFSADQIAGIFRQTPKAD